METRSLPGALEQIRSAAASFFDDAARTTGPQSGDSAWGAIDAGLHARALGIVADLADLATSVGPAIRRSPLLTDVDLVEAGRAIKGMRAALRFRRFRSWDASVLHDEDRVLGVQRAGEDDSWPETAAEAAGLFESWAESLRSRLDLVDPSGGPSGSLELVTPRAVASGYRPNTAFVMMWMAKDKPELTDLSNTIKRCFRAFDITAVRSDDIEHQEVITQRIVDEIRTSEFLIADLTGERPSVYYEVGIAHCLGKRPILYRHSGTPVHFDVAHYNCPEYTNLTDLEHQLMKRLEVLTGRSPRAGVHT